ncbi:MAG TPA: helix-turn-helix domain-containing protein [Gemmatimonadales bacterium]|nr:helix-turn-helix domain-containing protein [Gemmatimonadales bacterium]
MAAIGTLLESRPALQALRRTLPKGAPRITACRTPAALQRLLQNRLVDAIVLTPNPSLLGTIGELRRRLPGIPVIAYAAFRPDDGELLLACLEREIAAIVVEGVDDAVAGELVARHSATAVRKHLLSDAPRVLRLSEPLQQAAWEVLLAEVEAPIRTGALAARLGVSREHLSRQFGAGGAPNLKRVIDLTRIICAAQLLANPGYALTDVVRLLHFATSSHLNATSRRIAGVTARELGAMTPRAILAAFVQGNTRSR